MPRVVVIFGALLALAGAIGWGEFAAANYRLLEVLTVGPGDPLPSALGRMGPAGLSVAALATGVCLLCCGIVRPSAERKLAPLGRGLFVGASAFIGAGAVLETWAIRDARASFNVMAMSAEVVKPAEVFAALDDLRACTTAAGVLLAAGGVLALIAALAGFAESTAAPAGGWSAALLYPGLAGGGTLYVWLVSFFAWRHGDALRAALTGGGIVKPSQLAEHLSGALMCGLLSGLGMLLTCGALGLAALVASGSSTGGGESG